MKPVLIVYATREGHTRTIADHLVDALRARGREATLVDARRHDGPLPLEGHAAAILAASIHLGHHEREMEKLVVREREALEGLPTAFLSVSLSEVNVEDPTQPPEKRAQSVRELAAITDAFFEKTGWHPERLQPVAGALMYTQYNLLVRWVMKRIARSEGASTDTSRDHVYTDWEALDRFLDDFLEGVGPE
jgi:menaquinone-dependent protoporphyrinogen oxidase